MTTLKVKFKAIGYRGKTFTFTEKIECPDFEEKESGIGKFVDKKLIENGTFNTKITVKDQQENWLSDFDKEEIIIRKDLLGIIDWTIIEKIPKTDKATEMDKLKEILTKTWPDNPQMIIDFLTIFNEMNPSIKGLSFDKKFEIVTNAFLTTLKGQAEFGKHMVDILTGRTELQESETERLLKLKEKYENGL